MSFIITFLFFFLQSFFALVVRGKIQKGEWVLIHSAESTVGRAALSICLHKGCKIIAIVQSNENHENTLRHLKDVHVINNSSVESHVLALTGGEGVDVALSSLETNQHNQVLASCLHEDGRFLDISLPDSNPRKNLGKSPLNNLAI